jgi:hypothetical protein
VDENEHSMTFAGDVPEGSYARLMKANFDRLIDGAAGAAKTSFHGIASTARALRSLSVSLVENLFLSSGLRKRWKVREMF